MMLLPPSYLHPVGGKEPLNPNNLVPRGGASEQEKNQKSFAAASTSAMSSTHLGLIEAALHVRASSRRPGRPLLHAKGPLALRSAELMEHHSAERLPGRLQGQEA